MTKTIAFNKVVVQRFSKNFLCQNFLIQEQFSNKCLLNKFLRYQKVFWLLNFLGLYALLLRDFNKNF